MTTQAEPLEVPLVLYVLAGGASRRFGSDKARAVLDGSTLLEAVVRAFAPLTSAAFAVAAHVDAYQDLGVTTLADLHPGQGPLAGVHTALEHASATHASPWVLLASCDLIRPRPAWVRLLQQGLTTRHRAAVLHNDRFLEPFPGLYHTDLLSSVEHSLRQHDRSMQAFLRSLGPALHTRALPEMQTHSLDADRPDDMPMQG